MGFIRTIVAALALVAATSIAHAQGVSSDRAAYLKSSISRHLEMFKAQDFNRSERVTWQEAQGNVEFTSAFDDIDIDRDGIVTKAELDRYLALRFGYAPPR